MISHAHLDHSGYIPEIYTKDIPNWYSTPPTLDIAQLLWNDSLKIMGKDLPYNKSHIKKAINHWIPVLYEKEQKLGDITFKYHDAGHILGSASIELLWQNRRIVYTGDFKIEPTRMHDGAQPVEDVDVLIIETTYSDKDHPPRKDLEKQLKKEVEETLSEGGTVLFPAFAVGRSQELMLILKDLFPDVPLYLDGMSREVCRITAKYPEYIKSYEAFMDAYEDTIIIERRGQRREATTQPALIVSTAGMMEGGPALQYLLNLLPNSKIIFTGYNVEGTNGWRLLNEGKVKIDENILDVDLPVKYLDFSAHAGRSGLLKYIETANPERIILNHGDNELPFAKELEEKGYEVYAPKTDSSLVLKV